MMARAPKTTANDENDFSEDYAARLLRRVERKLRQSAKNRSRRAYARGYVQAANLIHGIVYKKGK